MFTKRFARACGLFMLGMGLFSLIPALSVYDHSLPSLSIESNYGSFLGVFPMNMINKMELMLMGIIGISCGNSKAHTSRERDARPSIIWSRILLYTMAALAILGSFEQTNTLGGYMPLFGSQVWLHSVLAILGGIFGYMPQESTAHKPRATLHRI